MNERVTTGGAAEAAAPRARRAASPGDGPAADPSARTPPASRRLSERSASPRRSRRFAFPEEPHDPRVVEAISLLLEGPSAPAPEPARAPGSPPAGGAGAAPWPVRSGADTKPADPRRGAPRASIPPLDSRADWYGALRHEAARHDRYGHPVAVAAIEVIPITRDGLPPARVLLDGVLGHVGALLRANARASDRLVRVGSLRFNALLPETGWDASRAFAERISALTSREVGRGTVTVRLRIAIGVPGTGESLEETLALTEAALVR